MANGVEIRSYPVFNEIADEYDRHRPAYPDALIDRACDAAAVAPRARVLEIGCGTGQLTRSSTAERSHSSPTSGWGWLGSYEVARRYVSDLFEDAQITAMPFLVEHTAVALNALLGRMSFWARLSPGQRDPLVAENHALYERLGRPIRSSTVACLVTARRAPPT
jgi:SAM-dependent methyltransferase